MADNTQAEAVVTPGDTFVTARLTFSGDADVALPGVFAGILSGSEGAWTFTLLPGGAGAVTAGTPRVTLASNDPAVTSLATLALESGGVLDDILAQLVTGIAVTVTGTVTANAGTNLNTSLLALEAGGNLAAATTSLAILDDWDESDRAKVNLVVGQAGVAAGVGASSATTQRVVLADSHGKTIKKAIVSLTASGNIVAAAGASKSSRVFAFAAQSRDDTMTLQVTDGSGGAALSLRWTFNAREGVSQVINPPAWLMKTTDNTALYATITGTGTVDIEVSYWDDDAA